MRVLAVDYGHKRVGLALSDPTGTIASPLTTLHVTSLKDAARKIVASAAAHAAEEIVIGLPKLMSGEEGATAKDVWALVEQISRRTNLPVKTFDERLTTKQAQEAMREGGLDSRAQRGRLDPIAASLILQGYLDTR